MTPNIKIKVQYYLELIEVQIRKLILFLSPNESEFYAVRFIKDQKMKQREFETKAEAYIFYEAQRKYFNQPTLLKVYKPNIYRLAKDWVIWFFKSFPYYIKNVRVLKISLRVWILLGMLVSLSTFLSRSANASFSYRAPWIHWQQFDHRVVEEVEVYTHSGVRRSNLRRKAKLPRAVPSKRTLVSREALRVQGLGSN